ncbi:MAG: PEP-CTERM sorting domain-containing protein [Phycisphaerae bacterium]|nr:PEP-CTERM sorting domain-containing protein [Phycisphaerae bacterium]MBN8598556.1 PEP-CTERM sorting domain-containing protein [Planctomycetota bacterium]
MNRSNIGIGLSSVNVMGMVLAIAAGAGAASAAITGVTGSTTWLGTPPVNCSPSFLMGGTVYTWDEQQNVSTSGVNVDMVNNPGTSSGAIAGTISGNFDSHFIHLEDYSGAGPFSGSVTFSGTIVGVIFINTTLDNTDVQWGAGGTIYPTGYPFRGLSTQSSFSILGNQIKFNLMAISPVAEVVQIRVLTKVPAPGSMALLGLGGLVMARRRR